MFEWWHWIVLGLCLVMSELVVPAFFVIWFGIGALLVGVSLLAMPTLGMAVQLMLWAGLSRSSYWPLSTAQTNSQMAKPTRTTAIEATALICPSPQRGPVLRPG